MDTLEEVRPVWAEVNLDNLAHNIKEVRKHIRKEALLTAVVKANGYGHGSVNIARTLLDNGANRLAVAILSEAVELRNNDISQPILILGYTPSTQYEKVVSNNLIQTIYTYEDAKKLSNMAGKLRKTALIHIKLDTGMGRIGFQTTDQSMEEILKISKLANLEIEGIYTHFAKADEKNKEHTEKQFNKFNTFVRKLQSKGLEIPIKHVANSAAIIDLPKYNLDMVRAGIMIYGYYPSDKVNKDNIELKPAMALKTRVSHIKTVPKGTGISYGQIFVTDKESKIATIPVGYADGFTRLLTEKAQVYIKGERVDLIGRICMDQCMIDVSNVLDVNVNDEVVLFGYSNEEYPHVEELAKKIDTINYEIICMVSRRVPRVYISKGEIIKIHDYLLD